MPVDDELWTFKSDVRSVYQVGTEIHPTPLWPEHRREIAEVAFWTALCKLQPPTFSPTHCQQRDRILQKIEEEDGLYLHRMGNWLPDQFVLEHVEELVKEELNAA